MSDDHNEAMRLAGELVAPIGTQTSYQTAHEAAALIRKQAERIAELEAENGKLRDGLAKGLSEKTMLTELAMRNGGLYAGIEGGAAAVLASAFAEQFTSLGGVNYVEVSFTHPATGPICVTLQRVQGKTPHQLRREAEAERDTLRAELETERMRLVACGVVAMANTAESAAKARDMHPDYLCASVRDVAAAVDREMALRAEVERLRVDAEQWQAHKEVLKASHLDESLTIRMTMRHKGLNVEREGVLTMLAADSAIAGGDEVAAHMAGRYFNEMKSAIDTARKATQ